jgi:hypothetical protein
MVFIPEIYCVLCAMETELLGKVFVQPCSLVTPVSMPQMAAFRNRSAATLLRSFQRERWIQIIREDNIQAIRFSRHRRSVLCHFTLNRKNMAAVGHVTCLSVIFYRKITWSIRTETIGAKVFRTCIRMCTLYLKSTIRLNYTEPPNSTKITSFMIIYRWQWLRDSPLSSDRTIGDPNYQWHFDTKNDCLRVSRNVTLTVTSYEYFEGIRLHAPVR